MAAAKQDFSIEQGTSRRIVIIYKDSDGNPIDLTNWCARITWKTNTSVTQQFFTGVVNSSYSFLLDGPNGKFTFLLPAPTTNDFTFNTAKYDLELQSPDDFYSGGGKYTKRILYGTITITKRFSQSSTELECQA